MASYFEILLSIAVILIAFYYYAVSNFDFWKKRGVVGPTPIPFFGNTKDLMFANISISHYVHTTYDQYKNEPMIGFYLMKKPSLILNDPELIKHVLIRDFSNFADRGARVHEKTEPLSPHLFNLEAERWRPLRMRLSPIFTSGKLKKMFYLIIECSQHLEKYLAKEVEKGVPLECRELAARFTTDVIGSCAFGIEMNALADERSEFRQMGKDFFDTSSFQNVFRIKMRQFFPKLYDLLAYIICETRLSSFFTKVVTDIIKYRQENDIVRPDFINMLMDLKAHPEKLNNIELTDSLLIAQVFGLFAGGFETSSTTISSTLYELAVNQEIQNKLREEIMEYCSKDKGELEFETVMEMEYLDKVFKESLRKYPSGSLLIRNAMSNYTFDGTKISIPKGTTIFIPVFALQRNSDIYPNPNSFDPERFNEDAVAARHPMHYLPFGDGPRNCMGVRFAIYQTKIGLITILRNYKVDVCEKTMIPYEINPASLFLAPKEGIYLKFTKLQRKCNLFDIH
nr:cytochrome P450 6a2-like isoform X2 [Osmia lignaria]XP_034178678.1 cytochrome P450 6a2-like isoform X2 [Osmia lignaria]XP_034178679.1 cytochrome P450 6a2-like isoform X2 [Osmia lignaria]XP_034178680.1 cytochrome P450 6a2-like isoform X2 [Osmia lignaria]XP_034178681.1 cytochrome P450 6a2-like isoform X2 [Osmia lignaria]